MGCQWRCPAGVGTPRRFNSSAMPRRVVMPAASISAMMGAMSAALAKARATWALSAILWARRRSVGIARNTLALDRIRGRAQCARAPLILWKVRPGFASIGETAARWSIVGSHRRSHYCPHGRSEAERRGSERRAAAWRKRKLSFGTRGRARGDQVYHSMHVRADRRGTRRAAGVPEPADRPGSGAEGHLSATTPEKAPQNCHEAGDWKCRCYRYPART
jgi:hypothetical protein